MEGARVKAAVDDDSRFRPLEAVIQALIEKVNELSAMAIHHGEMVGRAAENLIGNQV